jgi:MFS transporter, FHS family, glucose/mannose:H+ symporter
VRLSSLRRDSLILNLSFPLAGTVTTFLGTLLPLLMARWSLNDAQGGRLFTAQFIGAMAGSLSQGWISSRWGANRCVAAGYLLTACGVAGMAWGDLFFGMGAILVAGIGIGWSVPASNWLAAQYAKEGEAPHAINVLNAAWCAGAMAGPALLARAAARVGLPAALLSLSAVLLAAFVAATLLGDGAAPIQGVALSDRLDRAHVRRLALVAAAILFLYVGIENGINGWTPSLAMRKLHLTNADASLAQSAFWIAVLSTRIAVSFSGLSRWVGPQSLVAGLCTILTGVVCMTATQSRTIAAAGVLLSGIGCSTIFPTVVSLFQSRAGEGGEAWIGFVIAMGSCGASVIPWLMGAAASLGALGGLSGSLLLVTAAGCAGMMSLLLLLRRPQQG